MSSKKIQRDTIDLYLKQLAKEYRKLSGKTPIQLIIVGGSSILINYDFRDSTMDIDAYFDLSDAIKQAAVNVADANNLPYDWLNDDFRNTNSFTYKLLQFSTYYKTYSNVLEIRTIRAEYLIAMKLASGRIITRDLSDIVGIILEEKRQGNVINYDKINKAVTDLYGNWDKIKPRTIEFLNEILKSDNLEEIYYRVVAQETTRRNLASQEVKKMKTKLNKSSFDALINAIDEKVK